jgi:multiple sugar transport system ATP-binding protein
VEAMTMASRIAVMSHGVLQQIDTPQNLYDKPDNIFVAGFIGSPAMNFFNAHIRKSDGQLFVDGGSFQVRIPENRRNTFLPYLDKQVTFGIRPEDIYDPKYAPPGIDPQPVETRIDVTELMGNEIFVYLNSGEHNFVARVDPRTSFRMGEPAQVAFNMFNMHIFDRETEKAVR